MVKGENFAPLVGLEAHVAMEYGANSGKVRRSYDVTERPHCRQRDRVRTVRRNLHICAPPSDAHNHQETQIPSSVHQLVDDHGNKYEVLYII